MTQDVLVLMHSFGPNTNEIFDYVHHEARLFDESIFYSIKLENKVYKKTDKELFISDLMKLLTENPHSLYDLWLELKPSKPIPKVSLVSRINKNCATFAEMVKEAL